MSLIGNSTTPASYVGDYMQACVGMFGIPAGGFTADIEAFGASTNYDVSSLYSAMLNSTIGRSIFTPGSSDTTFATKLVEKLGGSLLSDDLETWAIDYAKTMLSDGSSRAEVAKTFVQAVAQVDTTDADFGTLSQQFANRIEVANYYTFSTTTPSSSLSTLTSVLSTVTNTTDVSDPAAVLDSLPGTDISTGQSYTLTTTGETLVGTSSADTFLGTVASSGATLTAGDNLNGGSGTDTLSITYTGTAGDVTSDAGAAATLTGFETFLIRAMAGTGSDGAVTLNASTVAGLTEIDSNLGIGNVSVTNVASGAAVGIVGNGSVTNGALGYAYKTATDAVTINLSGGVSQASGTAVTYGGDMTNDSDTGITATASSATTVTINSTGATNTVGEIVLSDTSGTQTVTTLNIKAATSLKVDVDGAGGVGIKGLGTNAKIVVSGAASSVNIGTLQDNVKTVDASGLTAGGLTAKLSTDTTSLTGGAGNDVITTVASMQTTAAVNAGSGTDILVITNSTDVNTTAKAAQYTNFETLRLAASQDMSLIGGITAVQLDAATSAVVSNMTATQAGAVTIRDTQTTALTLGLADYSGTSDVVSITVANSGETAGSGSYVATAIGGLTISGVETLNLTNTTGDTALTGNLTSIAFASSGINKLTTLNLNGDRSISVDFSNQSLAITTNTSGMTGSAALAVTAGPTVGGSVVNGTANGDTATAGTVASGTVTYNLAAGNDTFTATVAQLTTATVVDGGSGTDTLTITDTAGATLTDTNFSKLTSFEKIAFTGSGADSMLSGGFFNTTFSNGVTITDTDTNPGDTTYNLSTYNKDITATITRDSDIALTFNGGEGNDTITLTEAGGTQTSVVTVTGGAGNDTITVDMTAGTAGDSSVIAITGGTGNDTITISNVTRITNSEYASITVAAGDSSITAYDSVTGFLGGDGTNYSDKLDLANTATSLADSSFTTFTGYAAGELTVTTSNGIATFGGTKASTLTVAQKLAALSSVVTTQYATTAFASGSDLYVFQDADGAANGANDVAVKLVGLSGVTALATTNATTANLLFIA